MTDSIVKVGRADTGGPVIQNIAELEKKRDEAMRIYEGITPETAMELDLKTAKAARADLNAMYKELEDARKEVKREHMKQLEEFEAQVKGLEAPIKEAADALAEAVKAKEEAEREEKRAALRREYEEFAPFLACGENGPVLDFDDICEKKWLNRSTSFKKAVDEMQEKVSAISKDYESLKSQAGNLPHYAEDVAVFFRTLSLSEALENDARRCEEDARIAELQAQQAAQRDVEERPQVAPDTPPQDAPYVYEPDYGDIYDEEPEERFRYELHVEMTETQRDALVGWLKANGIHGTISREESHE